MKPKGQPGFQGLTSTQLDLLKSYEALLRDRGLPLGLVAEGDRDRLWHRHIADSLRGVPCIPSWARSVADLGSGGGLPGIPFAIARPDLIVHLVEKTSRRAAFLELVLDSLPLGNARVIASSIQEAVVEVDGCLARALASPTRAWQLASSLLPPDGFVLYWAGESWGPSRLAALSAVGVDPRVCSAASEAGQGSVIIMARKVAHPERGSQ